MTAAPTVTPCHDVAIIGGGPAGASAAITLAGLGRTVVVIEKEEFPRFKIGESLLPHSVDAFERLGVAERLSGGASYKKLGAEVLTADGSRFVRVYFAKALGAKRQSAYHVSRADFDKVLLDRAREVGVDVREACAVEAVEIGAGGFSRIRTRRKGARNSEELDARFVMDCSGRNAFLGTRMKLRRPYPGLNKFSVYAHYDGVKRESGRNETLIRLVRGRDCWFWLIPLSSTRTSVGVVMDQAFFSAQGYRTAGECLDDLVERHPATRDRLASAWRVTPVRSAGDYSYSMEQLTGPGWLAAGDAAGFVDPIFSTGVFLALHAGEEGAKAVHASLDRCGRAALVPLRRYEKEIRRVIKFYLGFVRRWYQPQFIEVFLNPEHRLGIASAVNAVLSGDVGRRFSVRWRLLLFYAIVWLQKRVPLMPRLGPKLEPTEKEGEQCAA